jgi:hypothetical protein
VGGLDDIASPDSQACIALARVHYVQSRQTGMLVLVKPNVFQGLPVDLQNFKREQPQFPQQATGDQFFSESQWESYHKLGELLGDVLSEHEVLDKAQRSWEWALVPDKGPHASRVLGQGATGRAGRMPAGQKALAAGVGAGALITAGLSAWGFADLLRATPQPPPAALAALVQGYGQLSQSGGPQLGVLAAQWLLLADQTCAPGLNTAAAAELRQSPLAQCMLTDVRRLCAVQKSPACERLLSSQRMSCLDASVPVPGAPASVPKYGGGTLGGPAPCPQ